DVLSEVGERVALAEAAFRSNIFVAASEGNGLEADKGDLLGVFNREFHDGADMIVVDVVHDGDNEDDFDTGFVHVFNGAKLDVEQVADLAVAVSVIADAVELEIGITEAGFKSLLTKFLALGELDTVGGGLHGIVANLAGIGDGVKEVRAHGGLATGELHGHLAARLDLDGVIEDFLNFFPRKLVDVANLVGVHEAGIAHHVATVGEIDGENGAAAVADVGGAMLVKALVIVSGNIAAGELRFDPLQEFGVNGHHVFVVAVLRAFLDHP